MCRDSRIDIRVTKEEKEKINKIAKDKGIKVSALILDSVLNGNCNCNCNKGANKEELFSYINLLRLDLVKQKAEAIDVMSSHLVQTKINNLDEITRDLMKLKGVDENG